MSPVERFLPSQPDAMSQEPSNSFKNLQESVEFVCKQRGILTKEEVEDEQSQTQFIIYTVGQSEREVVAVVLVRNEERGSFKLSDVNTELRPHKLIAPRKIINEVNTELAKKPQ